MPFTGLACAKFSENNENAKIAKFSIPLNLVIYRYMYHFHTSDQRIQPVHISHIALVPECYQDICTLHCAI